MDALIHAANLLRFCSLFQHDNVRPRLLTAFAAGLLIAYLATRAEPMIEFIAWNSFFIAVNLVQAGYELYRRRGAERSTDPALDPGSRGEHARVVGDAPDHL